MTVRRWFPGALAILLAACTATSSPSPSASPAGPVEQVLRVAYTELEDLDPATGELGSLQLLVQGLTAFDEELSVVPGLAESWDVDAGGTHLVFHLREAAYSNGVPITAGDFVAAWRRLLDPRTGPTFGYLLADVTGADALLTLDPESLPAGEEIDALLDGLGVTATDDRTLEVELVRPTPAFPTIVTNPATGPLPPGWIDRPGAMEGGAYVSSGPFILAEWVHGQRRVFEPNPNWWGMAPHLARIEMLAFDSTEAEIEAFDRNEIDLLRLDGPPDGFDPAVARPRPESALTTIGFMLQAADSPLARSPQLRRALSLAIDRDQVNATAGFSGPVATSPIPPGIPGHDPSLEAVYDVDAAQMALAAALDELGLRDPAEIHLTFLNGTRFGDAPQYIELGWEQELGIDIDRIQLEPDSYLARLQQSTDFDLFMITWFQDLPHPSNYLDVLWGCEGQINLQGYCNPDVDTLLEAAARESDPDAQLTLYADAQRLLVEDDAAIFVQWPGGTSLVAPRVQGLVQTPMDDFPGSVMIANVRIGP